MLVSAIMPTRGRPDFAKRALACFDSQTWPDKELVIADDADAPSFPNGIEGPAIQYHRLPRRLTVGAKRNICCSRAGGEIIVHLDDDDHSAPGRFADQVERLIASGKAVTAYRSMVFRDIDGNPVARYDGLPIGTSLCYTRQWWLAHPFADREVGEDGQFAMAAMSQSVSVDAGELMWATTHAGNTSPRDLRKQEWIEIVG